MKIWPDDYSLKLKKKIERNDQSTKRFIRLLRCVFFKWEWHEQVFYIFRYFFYFDIKCYRQIFIWRLRKWKALFHALTIKKIKYFHVLLPWGLRQRDFIFFIITVRVYLSHVMSFILEHRLWHQQMFSLLKAIISVWSLVIIMFCEC